MAEIKPLHDQFGVVFEAQKVLPDDKHRLKFLEALAELENNQCHKSRTFPVTRLHKVVGVKQAIYRADIDKMSGWRMHVQYSDGVLHLKDIVPGSKHDQVTEVIKFRKERYE